MCALKCDLRPTPTSPTIADDDDETSEPKILPDGRLMVTYEEGRDAAIQVQALKYLECSAMKNRGVNEAFTEAARVAMRSSREKKGGKSRRCCIM